MSDHVVLDAAVAVVQDLGARQVMIALSDGDGADSRIVASRGGRDIPAGLGLCADTADLSQEVSVATDAWTVTSVPMSSHVRGALVVQQVEGGRTLTDRVLRGFGRLIGLGLDRCADLNAYTQVAVLGRDVFRDELAAALRVDGSAPWTVISCDLNNFHLVNELLGFANGTMLLGAVAHRLLESLPKDALVARAFADHFLIAMPPQPEQQAAGALVEYLDDLLRQPVVVDGTTLCPSATFGLAVHAGGPIDADAEAEALIAAADHDLRLKKDRRDGRQHAMGSLERLSIDTAMHAALGSGSVTAFFQPLYDLKTGALTGFEALARWTSSDGQDVPPNVFIPIAESNGLIHALGDHMLSEVKRLLARYADEPNIVLHVNVSATQLASPGYAARFVKLFSNDATALRRVTVEVTESKQIVDHDAVAGELRQLRVAGVGVALDDFGTGFSTLSQLRTMPVTHMKIDKFFVQQAVSSGTAALDAMISLARAFELRVVAEGVETLEQLHMLERLGCDRVQGFLFSRAVAPEALSRVPRTISSMLSAV